MRHSEYIIITISFSYFCSCVTYNDHCTLALTFRYYYCHWHCLLAWTKPTPPPTLTTTQPSLILIPFGTELNSTTSRSTMNDATTTTSELSSSYHPRNKFLSPPVELSWAVCCSQCQYTQWSRGDLSGMYVLDGGLPQAPPGLNFTVQFSLHWMESSSVMVRRLAGQVQSHFT